MNEERKQGLVKAVGFGLLILAIAAGMFYIGGVTYCQNGGGAVVSGYKCINTEYYAPMVMSDGTTKYIPIERIYEGEGNIYIDIEDLPEYNESYIYAGDYNG